MINNNTEISRSNECYKIDRTIRGLSINIILLILYINKYRRYNSLQLAQLSGSHEYFTFLKAPLDECDLFCLNILLHGIQPRSAVRLGIFHKIERFPPTVWCACLKCGKYCTFLTGPSEWNKKGDEITLLTTPLGGLRVIAPAYSMHKITWLTAK